jgi:hypothetical protein
LSIDRNTGIISGTPTVAGPVTIVASVTDSTGTTATRNFDVTFTLSSSPALSFTGIGTSANPQTQPTFGIMLASGFPADIQGTLTLSFQPATGSDSGEVVFANGGRTLTFTIPANSTSAVFAGSSGSQPATAGIQTGTVAGVITLTAVLTASGLDVTPSPAPSIQVRVSAGPPVITSVTATRNSSGFTVAVTGYSTTREVSQAVFQFNAANGGNLQTNSLTVPVTTIFAPWLQGTQVVGSQFLYTQTFTIQGSTQSITSVSVTLTNTQGNSQAQTATLQ